MKTEELIKELKEFKKHYMEIHNDDLAIIIGYTILHMEQLVEDNEALGTACHMCPYQKFYRKVKEEFKNIP